MKTVAVVPMKLNNRRLPQKSFQHTGTGTEPMGSLTPSQLLQLML